jgi:uncharacterized coiled-coil DUF342 family protein
MAKTWEQMTAAEKTEHLHREMLRAQKLIESIEHRLANLANAIDDVRDRLKSVETGSRAD